MVAIKATHIVRPASPTPNETMYLNSCDQIKDITHTPTIYFYKHSPNLVSENPILALKDSLSKVLVSFYPLAGRLTWDAEGGNRVELRCNAAGVPILEAESASRIEDFGDFTPGPEIQALIPTVDYTAPLDEIPLVMAQMTRLACGGLALGLEISHVMADGPSALHFVGEWANLARGGADPTVSPFLDRRVVDGGGEDNMEQKRKPTCMAFLRLTQLQIEKIRSKADVDYPEKIKFGSRRGYSRFEAVAAHVWQCTSKARAHVPEQQTSLHFMADFRNKMKPPLPKNYFGNALICAEAMDTSGSLLASPIGNACWKIREAVEGVTDGSVRGYLDFLKGLSDVGRFRSLDNNGRPKGDFYGNLNLAIISWMGLPLYGTDFGWGSEVHVGPGQMGFDGKTFIIPGREGDGSLNVAIWLQDEHMGAFKKCFYDDI
ncbi:HXXXD-type acyl-transferase family protein [Striga asiatica]|uniref:HXXXD-type acyl-transferase family protein n=1 Tax=Striga asiatica TaxID=4170 RepID=A0A5A7Q3P7_STRAF|nr:HXXXD-type acyl-transferase family protein [Striga asiatica]